MNQREQTRRVIDTAVVFAVEPELDDGADSVEGNDREEPLQKFNMLLR